MNRTIRAVVWGLVVGGLLSLSCASENNPPEPPNGGTGGGSTTTDGGPSDAGGGGGGAGGGGGGGAGRVSCDYDGGAAQSFDVNGNTTTPGGSTVSTITIDRTLANEAPACVRIVLLHTDGGAGFFGDGGLSLPPFWRLESSFLRDRACTSGGTNGISAAVNVTGTVTFQGAGSAPFPSTLSINAVVESQSGSGFPARVCIARENLTVQ